MLHNLTTFLRWSHPRARIAWGCLAGVTLVAAILVLRAGAQPAWKQQVSEAAALVLPVNSTGAIPREVKVDMHRCNSELLTRDQWTVAEVHELMDVLDRGLLAMKGKDPSSDAYAWASATASAPVEAIQTRFHCGAPVSPDAAAEIHQRLVKLMKHDSLHKRLEAVSAAIGGYMENCPEVREQIHRMVNDQEPLIAAVCRRFVSEEQSPQFTQPRAEIQRRRGY